MTNQINNIVELSMKQLLDSNDRYVIPIYQRNYAWGESEINQLIQDIIDYCLQHNANNYYLGTLVIYERAEGNKVVYETIDGQQRLTTLSILVSSIKNRYKEIDFNWFDKLNLEFDSRKISTESLKAIHSGDFQNQFTYNEAIKNGYELIGKILPNKLKENGDISIETFCEYLMDRVKILRVPVPEDTDLNHYFEIMNNRGEQLEKHEILKSKFLDILNDADESQIEIYSQCFHLIWEACSNMEKYVQYGFSIEQRNNIFGARDWSSLTVVDFDDICTKSNLKIEVTEELSLSDIIVGKTSSKLPPKDDDNPDRFNSVINFPNFLLHVLRIQTQKDKVALDDKRLLIIFEDAIKESQNKIQFVKDFAFNLLKCKFLFDKYVIKREFLAGTEKWSLKRLKWYENNKVSYVNSFGDEENDGNNKENRTILMLLSMFHVSAPTLIYKHWLNATLNYLFTQKEIKPNEYINRLEDLANAFLFDRFLAIEPKDYFEIIFTNTCNQKNTLDDIDLENLTYGKLQNNLVFNYLDYLLWKEHSESHPKIRDFEFTSRSSVEHYYPQHPFLGFEILDSVSLNSFGNLCLISNSENSKLSHYQPIAKKEHYAAKKSIGSIKQFIMMNDYNPLHWNIESILKHNEKMTNIILSQLKINDLESPIKIYEDVEILSPKSKAISWFEDYQITNKVLLARALMCFGQIDYEIGWTSGGGKWNFYKWDKIRESEVYRKFVEFVDAYNPESLSEIIDYQLKENLELRNDSYRYVFVSRPEIMEYCLDGNYGWLNDGTRIILLQGSRASLYGSCEMYSFLLSKYLLNKYKITSYCGNDRLKITLIENKGFLEISSIDWNNEFFLEIWNNGEGKLCYEVNVDGLHGNSKVIKNLKDLGWEYNSNGRFYHSENPIIIQITEDIENNILESLRAFDAITSFLGES